MIGSSLEADEHERKREIEKIGAAEESNICLRSIESADEGITSETFLHSPPRLSRSVEGAASGATQVDR